MDDQAGTLTPHRVLACADQIEALLDDLGQVRPEFMSTAEKAAVLLQLTTLTGRLEAVRLSVIAGSDDVANDAACRTVADWLAPRTKSDRRTCARSEQLAQAVDTRYGLIGEGLRLGRISVAQAEVIVNALDELPPEVGPKIRDQAELALLGFANAHAPDSLRKIGAKIISVVAPGVADDAERKALETAERRAEAATRLSMRRRSDGSTDISARIPDAIAARLKNCLEAFTAPRQTHITGSAAEAGGWTDPSTGIKLTGTRLAGEAFCALIESLDANRLPHHGGAATTISINLDLDDLREDLVKAGVIDLDQRTQITAGQARRLACNAALLPAVLGKKSEVMDLGRTSRLFSPAQRKAMSITQRTCRAVDCTMPSTWCEGHHYTNPWSQGCDTDLADGVLLCHWHHKRAHDTRFTTDRTPNGDIRYHRRP